MYKFNLEPLLNHRRYQEEVLQKELAAIKRQLTEEERALKGLSRSSLQGNRNPASESEGSRAHV